MSEQVLQTTTNTPEQVRIDDFIDHAKFTPFHWTVLLWCLLIIIFDGYDLAIYGVALPLLMEQWSLTSVEAGWLASSALFGMMFGAIGFGTLSDKLGRKKTIMLCILLFAGFTFWVHLLRLPYSLLYCVLLLGSGLVGLCLTW